MTGAVVYSLCALTALLCAWLLTVGYLRRRSQLLLWSGLSFAGLFVNNLLLVFDKLVFLQVDLSVLRSSVALAAMAVLLYGLIWHNE
jgi:hypothetical protein